MLEQALKISRAIRSRETELAVLNESGALDHECGDLGLARSSHRQALEIARQLGSAPGEAKALVGLAGCARSSVALAKAEDKLRGALAICQQIGAAPAATTPDTSGRQGSCRLG